MAEPYKTNSPDDGAQLDREALAVQSLKALGSSCGSAARIIREHLQKPASLERDADIAFICELLDIAAVGLVERGEHGPKRLTIIPGGQSE